MTRRFSTVDEGFVPAPPGVVYEWLSRPEAYDAWWPGTGRRAGRVAMRLGRARLTAAIADGRERPGVGLVLELAGDAKGNLEWYLEPVAAGTVVHAIAELRPARRWRAARVIRFRGGIRDGLVALRRRAERP